MVNKTLLPWMRLKMLGFRKMIAAASISIFVGVIGFFYFQYSPSELILEMRTSNNGLGQVFWNTGDGYSLLKSYPFLIKRTEEFETYSIPLPAKRLRAVRIDPMQAPGDFEIKSIRIIGPDITLEWIGRDLAQELAVFKDVEGSIDVFSGTFKGKANTGDPALIIRSVDGIKFKRPIGFRFMLSLFFACGSFIVIFVMIRMKLLSPDNFMLNTARLAWLIFVVVYLYYFYHVWIYAVDVPSHDEWSYFLPHALPEGLTAKWLFAFHNEHRIVFTKFLSWIFFKVNALNFAYQQIFNYILFAGVLATVVYAKKVAVGARQFLFFPAFLIFLLSPIAYLNHTWGFQSQFHFLVLFAVLASVYAFLQDGRSLYLIFFLAFTLFAMYSFSSGVVIAAVYLICFSIYIAGKLFNGLIEKKKAICFGFSALLIIGTAILLWFNGYVKPQHHPPIVLPTTLKFWDFYLNVLSHGYGFDSTNFIFGILGALISLVPLSWLLIRRISRWQSSTWQLITITLSIFAALAAITLGRAAFGIQWSKKSHYTEISFLLIPFAAMAWWLLLKNLPKFRNYVLCLLWLFCFIGYLNNWSIAPYVFHNEAKMQSLTCIYEYYIGIGGGNCPQINDFPIHERLDQAKHLEVSFYRRIILGI